MGRKAKYLTESAKKKAKREKRTVGLQKSIYYIWEKYFPRGQMPSARQKRHQTVSMKLANCQYSCRVFVLTSRSDHVIIYATEKLIMDGGLPNYRPTRLNDSGNFFRPLTKNRRFFHIFIFYLNSPNHALHSCILLGVFLVGKSYWISIFNVESGHTSQSTALVCLSCISVSSSLPLTSSASTFHAVRTTMTVKHLSPSPL